MDPSAHDAPQTCKRPRQEPGAPDTNDDLAQVADTDPGKEAVPVVTVQHASGSGSVAELASPCPACGYDRRAEFDRLQEASLAAWRAGYRTGRDGVDELRLSAFADGWRCAFEAAAERGAA